MANRFKKPEIQVFEQQGEVDEEDDDNQENVITSEQKPASGENSTNISSKLSELPLEPKTAQQITTQSTQNKQTQQDTFSDIIGLAKHFEDYKSAEVLKLVDEIDKLKLSQLEANKHVQAVRSSINEEERIKEIRQVFQKAPLYILKLKGLKNRMNKVSANLQALSQKHEVNLSKENNEG